MTRRGADKPSILFWDVSHLGDDAFDATLVKFPGWEDTVNLIPPFTYQLPADVRFEANFATLDRIDYPYNDVRWPITSERMLHTLTEAGSFAHEVIRLTMIDDTVPSKARQGPDGRLKPEVTRRDLAAVKVLELLDVFDWNKSQYDKDDDFPTFASHVRRWVLRRPERGFPTLFRVSANPVSLFVSAEARGALQRGGVKGVEFQDIVEVS